MPAKNLNKRVPNSSPEEEATPLFQPILSIKKKAAVGLEVISSPGLPSGNPLERDRAMRTAALAQFKKLSRPDFLLFLRFNSSIVDQGVVGSNHLLDQVQQHELNPHNIVIGITDSKVDDLEALQKFIETYREYGFLIALNAIGSGHSNLNRIALAKPDILKIDEDLIREVDREYYKREILKSLVSLSKRLGMLMVAEGVSLQEETLAALELGVDMVQGDYVASPGPAATILNASANDKITALTTTLKKHALDKLDRSKKQSRQHSTLASGLAKTLSQFSPAQFDTKLREFAKNNEEIECFYTLDDKGTQITDTVSLPDKLPQQKRLFRPADKGADHSSKDYYYLLMDSFINRYTTEPYISMASGTLCVTLSVRFRDRDNDSYILCLDFPLGSDF